MSDAEADDVSQRASRLVEELRALRAKEGALERQGEIYARELRELYRKQRAPVDEMREKAARIKEVLRQGGPRMVFQPIVDLTGGEVRGIEALARFDLEPVRTPDVWFDEAADAGLGVELELAAVRAALAYGGVVPAGAYLSVNLSPDAVSSDEFTRITSEQDCGALVVELTEHARVDDYEVLGDALRRFRERGGRVAIDDAGAGFSSLRHILLLGPDIIKLDTSLTNHVDSEPAKRALASALIAFASGIDAVVVAEGIETEDELTTLRALGVRYGQGFHLGRPAALVLSD